MPALQNVRLRNLFRKPLEEEDYGTISPLRDYLMDSGLSDENTFVSPVEPSLDTPQLGRTATDITAKTGEPKYDWKRMIDELYTPATESRDRFNRLLESFPQREEPGFLRKLVASGASLGNVRRKIPGGLEAAENVMYAPYMRDVGEWKERAEPYAKAAQLENTANQIERQLAGNILTAQTQAERIAETERHNRQREESERIRALAYRAKAEGYKIDKYGSRIMGFKPDGSSIDLGDSGMMDQRDLEILRGEYRVEAAKQGAEAAAERVRMGGYEYIQDGQGNLIRVNPIINTIEPPTATGPFTNIGAPQRDRQLTPEQERAALSNTLQRIYTTDPTKRKFIEANDDGTYTLIEPPSAGVMPWSWGQADVDEYNKFAKEIYGLAPAAPAPAPGPRTAAPPPVTPVAAPPGNVPPQTIAPQVPPPRQRLELPPEPQPVPPAVPPRTQYPSSGAYGPGATPGATPGAFQVPPFMGPRQPPGPIVNPPSSSAYGPGATPRPTTPPPPAQPKGYTVMVSPSGQQGLMPSENVQAAIARGYKVVE